MPLYSSDIHSKAMGQRCDADDSQTPAERGMLPAVGCTSWCYLFAHHAKVSLIEKLLSTRFRTFIHKTTIYKKENKQIRKHERQTISGLVFVQGDKAEIQDFLAGNCPGTYLANDCSTKTTAVIPDRIMRPFMQLDVGRSRIRFMPHPLSYYSEGHPLVRVTSGLLTGFEGYRVRISRNKCLVTSIGGMTVAINGVDKDSFEHVDEYIKLRRMQQKPGGDDVDRQGKSAPGVDECFFKPQSQLDIMAIAQGLGQYVDTARARYAAGDSVRAADTLFTLLEKTERWLQTIDCSGNVYTTKDILAVCGEARKLLGFVAGNKGTAGGCVGGMPDK